MRNLQTRIKRLENIQPSNRQPPQILISTARPFNYWDVDGDKCNGKHFERKGDPLDYQTLIDLEEKVVAYAESLEQTMILHAWTHNGNKVSYQLGDDKPKGLQNVHLADNARFEKGYIDAVE